MDHALPVTKYSMRKYLIEFEDCSLDKKKVTFDEYGDYLGNTSLPMNFVKELVMVSLFVVKEYHLNIFKLGNC